MLERIIDQLIKEHKLSKEEYLYLLEHIEEDGVREQLRKEALRLRKKYYGDQVFVRGLIEFTNYCKNNCYYCGIRKSNHKAKRYRLDKESILESCQHAYELGYRTFVLQGGEDPYYNDERMCEIVRAIRKAYPMCAITLSIGERSRESYAALKEAGADRYLLRHETATQSHYAKLHPQEMKLANRMKCLQDLKELGYQVGAGMMVGAPGQTKMELAEDLFYLQKLHPHMVGLGPFIPHQDTPFAQEKAGSLESCLDLLSIVRIMLPKVLLPATTALATIEKTGREQGLLVGCNVIMPNISPQANRKDYMLYDHKVGTEDDSEESLRKLAICAGNAGCQLSMGRGDSVEG